VFFEAICQFWADQHRDIAETIDRRKIAPRSTTNIVLYSDVISHVHNYALLRCNSERFKLPAKPTDIPSTPCVCSIRLSLSLLCFHKIQKVEESSGVLSLSQIDPYWYLDRSVVVP